MSEEDIITAIRKRSKMHNLIDLGIGDDSAIFHLPENRKGLVTSDMVMDGVHFDSRKTPLELIGRKALAVNLSDIAAMAGQPFAAFVSLALPRINASDIAHRIHGGITELAEKYSTVIAGGDTNIWNGPLVVSLSLLGLARSGGSILRSGARIGDSILVTGSLGGSLHGRHLTFNPRVAEAQYLADHFHIHSMTDLSDGLASDVRDICDESKVGAELYIDKIPCSQFASADDPIQSAMCDGEDFELCFTAAPDEAERIVCNFPFTETKVTIVGKIVAGPGLFWRKDTERWPCNFRGFKHL